MFCNGGLVTFQRLSDIFGKGYGRFGAAQGRNDSDKIPAGSYGHKESFELKETIIVSISKGKRKGLTWYQVLYVCVLGLHIKIRHLHRQPIDYSVKGSHTRCPRALRCCRSCEGRLPGSLSLTSTRCHQVPAAGLAFIIALLSHHSFLISPHWTRFYLSWHSLGKYFYSESVKVLEKIGVEWMAKWSSKERCLRSVP